MVPSVAAEKIRNLLISTNQHGASDHKTHLAAYQELDHYLEEKIEPGRWLLLQMVTLQDLV